MRTEEIQIFNFDELSDEAKEKAINHYREYDRIEWLSDALDNSLIDSLKQNDIEGTPELRYSLSYCQGDGVSFTGKFIWKKLNIDISVVDNHYTHKNTVSIDIFDDEVNEVSEDVYEEFKQLYSLLCDEIEKYGYSIIEEVQSDEYIKQAFDDLEYEFTVNGEVWLK